MKRIKIYVGWNRHFLAFIPSFNFLNGILSYEFQFLWFGVYILFNYRKS